ncbi:MAG: sodium:calcium symporter [Gemmatimonadota bacterium]
MSHSGERERWGSRIGLILAMAGNAVGLGNFLRFPRQAVMNGGGTFMIPYFIAFILVGIPLMWVEWGIGRRGGQHGHGSLPGQLQVLWKHPIAKYLGVMGLFNTLVVLIYYCYIESWTLAWTFFSVTGDMRGLDEQGMKQFLYSYQNLNDASVHATWVPFAFFFVTLAINFWIVKKGVAAGIEKLAKIGMPILFIFAAILVVRVLTLGPHEITVDGVTTTSSPMDGLNFMYTPVWSALAKPAVWLAAAGQIFFTLSVGMGSLSAYASYLKKDDDLALSGLATAATNETAEVVLGGSLAIPAIVAFFGVTAAITIANAGGFDLGFISMPLVFNLLPGGFPVAAAAGFMWFSLLFFAGITSSVAMALPALSFMEENFGWSRKKSVAVVAALAIGIGLFHIIYYQRGFLDEWDYWAGTFGLVVCALFEVIVFVWIFGPNNAWDEINQGAQMRIPAFFKFVLTYVTPLFLLILMGWWTVKEAIPTLLMTGKPESEHLVRWASRAVMFGILVLELWLIRAAWKRRAAEGRA